MTELKAGHSYVFFLNSCGFDSDSVQLTAERSYDKIDLVQKISSMIPEDRKPEEPSKATGNEGSRCNNM